MTVEFHHLKIALSISRHILCFLLPSRAFMFYSLFLWLFLMFLSLAPEKNIASESSPLFWETWFRFLYTSLAGVVLELEDRLTYPASIGVFFAEIMGRDTSELLKLLKLLRYWRGLVLRYWTEGKKVEKWARKKGHIFMYFGDMMSRSKRERVFYHHYRKKSHPGIWPWGERE